MRVKISPKNYDLETFVFGKKYYIAYAGITYGEEFIFTRKNRIEMCEYDVNHKKLSSHWVSKKLFKKIINSGSIRWISELEE